MDAERLWTEYAEAYNEVVQHISIHQELMKKALRFVFGYDVLLDQGCGVGTLTRATYSSGKDIYGIDLIKAMLDCAIRNSPPGITYSQQDATDLQFPEKKFEAVTCLNVAYAIDNYQKAFSEAFRVLRDGGVYVVNFLKPGVVMEDFIPIIVEDLRKKGLLEKFKDMLAKGQKAGIGLTERFTHRMEEKQLLEELANAGFQKVMYSDNHDYAGKACFAVVTK